MSKTIDYLILFSSGLILGIFSTSKYWESVYKQRSEEEIESVKNAFRSRENDKDEPEPVKEFKAPEEPEKHLDAVPPALVNIYRSEVDHENEVDYGKYFDASEGSESTKVKIIEEEAAEKEFPHENDPPRIISEEEYYETEPTFDKMCCTLYAPNRVVVDDLSREVIDDFLVGPDNIDHICDTLPKIVYVRNESIGCDLEISVEVNSIEDLDALVYFK